jgi:hypothetical protein
VGARINTTVIAADDLGSAEEDVSYRNVSVLSIVSLVVGLISPLSLVAPLLWAIPMIGAALSLAAIFRIASSDGALIGRRAALAALALCVASIAAAASRSVLTQQFISHRARQTALEWIALVQAGDGQRAFDLTVDGNRPAAASSPDTQEGSDEGAESPFERFRKNPVVDFLTTGGAALSARFERDLTIELLTRGEARVEQQYTFQPAEGGKATPAVTVQIDLVRTGPSALVPSRWLVSSFKSDDLPSRAATAVP